MRLPFRIAAKIFTAVGFDVTSAWPYVLFARKSEFALRERALEQLLFRTALAKLLKDTSINCVIDVGANLGQYARMLRELGYEGYIVSFEPVPELSEQLKTLSKADSKWLIYECGLGSTNEMKPFHRTRWSSLSSFLTLNDYAREQFGTAQEVISTETTEIRRLDSILKTIELPITEPRYFLKLDTQGYDLEVFAGLGDEIKKFWGLQAEVYAVPFYEKMPLMGEALRVYESSGFLSQASSLFAGITRRHMSSTTIA